jgi:predicted restriction endonuclease
LTTTEKTTIGDIRQRAKYQTNARIRQLARKAYQLHGLPLRCQVCDYSTHVEICHRLAISNFPDHASIVDVNSRDNLVCLCPNHHWEFDHGLLSL